LTKIASPEANTMELKINAMLVNHASMDKFSIEHPTYVTLDHLLHVDVSKRDLKMDIHVYNAHSTKLLIHKILMNVWLNFNAQDFRLDSQEIIKTVEDAKTAISQPKFQTMNKPDVLLDQSQPAHAFKEVPIKVTPVLIASQVKLLILLIQTETPVLPQHHAWVHNKLPLQLTELTVVDAKLANFQDKFQILQRLDASIDHSPFVVAQRDNQLMDILARHAQQDKLLCKTIQSNAILQLAQELTKLDQLLINTTVEDVKLANSQHSSQMLRELLVSQDQLLLATLAQLDNQMMDTHVLHAHQEKFNTKFHHMMLKVT